MNRLTSMTSGCTKGFRLGCSEGSVEETAATVRVGRGRAR